MRRLAFLLTALWLPAAALPAAAQTIRVVPTQFPTVQAAVTASDPGDVVSVLPGVYKENVTVPGTKAGLQIIGTSEKKVTIDAGAGSNPAIIVNAAGVTIARLTVRNGKNQDGIRCLAADCTIESVRALANGGHGVHIDGPGAYVGNSTFTGNAKAGLNVNNGDGAQVLDNLARNNGEAGFKLDGDGMAVEDNVAGVTDSGEGLSVNGHDNGVRQNSVSSSSGAGIKVTGHGNVVEDNDVTGARTDCFVVDGDDATVVGNEAESCNGNAYTIGGRNPQVIDNAAVHSANDGFRITCANDCTAFLVEGNSSTGALSSDGFDITVPALSGGAGDGWVVEKNEARNSTGNGFRITGSNGIVRKNQALANGTAGSEHGFFVKGNGNTVDSNKAADNAGDGLHVEATSSGANTLVKNRADRNAFNGIHLEGPSNGSTLSRNSAGANLADGLRNDGQNTVLTGNKAKGNRVDCTSDLAGGATVATDTRNKCDDGSSFVTSEDSGIH
jgi:parallel beta-helix repeat protein